MALETLSGFAADFQALRDRRRPGRTDANPDLIPLLRGEPGQPEALPAPVAAPRRTRRLSGKTIAINMIFLLGGLPIGAGVRHLMFALVS